MPNLNSVALIGHVGKSPELRFTPNGTSVCDFSIAVNRRWTTRDGEKKEETDWFTVVVWGKLAESCNQFVAKGSLIFVSGSVSLHKWTTQDSEERSRLEVRANSVVFLSKKTNGESNAHELEPEDVPF